jgi:hypothetical protein
MIDLQCHFLLISKEKTMAINILSIDGGGIKGIIPARILSDVEDMIKQVSGDPNKTIADCFLKTLKINVNLLKNAKMSQGQL